MNKFTKDAWIEVALEVARASRVVQPDLKIRFAGEPTKEALVVDTHRAIQDTTDFDEREIHRHVDDDHAAYHLLERNVRQIAAGPMD